MKTRLPHLILCLAVAALVSSCGPSVTRTPRPTDTPAPPTPSPSPTPATLGEKVNQGIDGVMTAYMKTRFVTACSVVVVAAGATPATGTPTPAGPSGALTRQVHSFGTLSAENPKPVDKDTEYEIGGLTKLFTATVLAVRNFDGSLPIGDPVQKYLPEGMIIPLVTPDANVTLKDLALHGSGLPHHAQAIGGQRRVNGLFQEGYASDDDMARFLTVFHPVRLPNEKWEYSNVGYGLLGMAEAFGTVGSYDRGVNGTLGISLGLNHTQATPDAARVAQGYDDAGAHAAPFATEGDLMGAGGLRSTPDDLGLFLQAAIAPENTRYTPAFLLTRQPLFTTPDPAVSQGLGWLIYHAGKPDEVFYKAGLTAGFSSYMAYSAVKQAGYAVLCNAPGVSKVVPQLNALLDAPDTPVDADEVAP